MLDVVLYYKHQLHLKYIMQLLTLKTNVLAWYSSFQMEVSLPQNTLPSLRNSLNSFGGSQKPHRLSIQTAITNNTYVIWPRINNFLKNRNIGAKLWTLLFASKFNVPALDFLKILSDRNFFMSWRTFKIGTHFCYLGFVFYVFCLAVPVNFLLLVYVAFSFF